MTLIVAVAVLIAGCVGNGEGYKFKSQGAPYELVVVADHDRWDGAVGDTLRLILNKQVPMINRQETIYKTLRVLPSGFVKLVKRHPNVLIVRVSPDYESTDIKLHYDVYAEPQIVIELFAPNDALMAQLISSKRNEITMLIEKAERDRTLNNARLHGSKQVKELVRQKFGFDIDMTPGFTVRSEKEDMLWISYELPMASQGVVIYTYPFSGVQDFKQADLISRRNDFVKNIPGPSDGSYMITNPDYIELFYKQINERSWSEMHGFWDVANDHMGGPFANFSTLDAANQRVIAIDFYVYSPNPNLSQRSYKKQLEHFIYSVNIPE